LAGGERGWRTRDGGRQAVRVGHQGPLLETDLHGELVHEDTPPYPKHTPPSLAEIIAAVALFSCKGKGSICRGW